MNITCVSINGKEYWVSSEFEASPSLVLRSLAQMLDRGAESWKFDTPIGMMKTSTNPA